MVVPSSTKVEQAAFLPHLGGYAPVSYRFCSVNKKFCSTFVEVQTPYYITKEDVEVLGIPLMGPSVSPFNGLYHKGNQSGGTHRN
jgi:hypothetical protein